MESIFFFFERQMVNKANAKCIENQENRAHTKGRQGP